VKRAGRRRGAPLAGARLDRRGWLSGVSHLPSPNCDQRPADTAVRLVVVHGISLPPGEFGGAGVLRLFTNCLDPDEHPYYRDVYTLRVSAHFLIRRNGEVIQFVACDDRAWHAGVSCWKGAERCNDFSIGIEIEGCDTLPFDARQYPVLAKLVKLLAKRYSIEDVVGHSDIAPGRKSDPGPHFDWALLRRLLADANT
jgi:AmpD protein